MRVLEPTDKFKKYMKEAKKHRNEVESIEFDGFKVVFRPPVEKVVAVAQNKEVALEKLSSPAIDLDELMITNPLEYERRVVEMSNGEDGSGA